MILSCPRCSRIFDTDTERDLDPNGIVCGRCVEALDPEGTGKVPAWSPCIGKDRLCPCQDGLACHYRDTATTKAMPLPDAAETPPVARRLLPKSTGCLIKSPARTRAGRLTGRWTYEVYDGMARLVGRFTSAKAADAAFAKLQRRCRRGH